MEETLTIKKYSNRRLYDTEENSYVTLARVAERIKDGRRVEVVDARTGEDVTAGTLTQILVEEARKNNVLLPVPVLHLCIQFGDTVLQEFFGKYLQHAIRGYLAHKAAVDEQFGQWLEFGSELASPSAKTVNPLEVYAPFLDFLKEMTFSGAADKKENKSKNKK